VSGSASVLQSCHWRSGRWAGWSPWLAALQSTGCLAPGLLSCRAPSLPRVLGCCPAWLAVPADHWQPAYRVGSVLRLPCCPVLGWLSWLLSWLGGCRAGDWGLWAACLWVSQHGETAGLGRQASHTQPRRHAQCLHARQNLSEHQSWQRNRNGFAFLS